jgi:cytochrome oxidase Cu insertion factor (SCO1/SenC/PrrC family)
LALPLAGDDGRRTLWGRLKMFTILLVCAAPVLASYLTYYVIRPGGRTNYGQLINPSKALPPAGELQLSDLQGKRVDPASLRGQWLLVVVADGRCERSCEDHLYAQRQLRETLGREKDRLDRVWLVTGGHLPRPDLLPALAQATVLQADEGQLAHWLQPEPGRALAEHLYVVDPMGQWMLRFPAQADPARSKRDLERLLRASAFWDQPGRDALPAR